MRRLAPLALPRLLAPGDKAFKGLVVAATVLLAVPGLAEEEPEPAAEGSGIRIRVTGLRSDDGQLACGLFVEENWLRAGAVPGEGGAIVDGSATCFFPEVEPEMRYIGGG
jgi:hypothetical protein